MTIAKDIEWIIDVGIKGDSGTKGIVHLESNQKISSILVIPNLQVSDEI